MNLRHREIFYARDNNFEEFQREFDNTLIELAGERFVGRLERE